MGELAAAAHADVFARPGAPLVDLHWTLIGATAPPAELWRALGASTKTISVGGAEVETLSDAATACVVALHAAAHGPARVQTMADLERAVRQLDEPTWRRAAGLAEELQASPSFGAGLRLIGEGASLAARLGLSERTSIEAALAAGAADPLALGIEKLIRTPGLRAKLALLIREAVPSRRFMSTWSPPARRGGLPMLVAYLSRAGRLLWHTPTAVRDWRRAARRVRGACDGAVGWRDAVAAGARSSDGLEHRGGHVR